MKSINPSPDFGTPCSGQSVNWNCLTVRDWPSFREKAIPGHRGGHQEDSASAQTTSASMIVFPKRKTKEKKKREKVSSIFN